MNTSLLFAPDEVIAAWPLAPPARSSVGHELVELLHSACTAKRSLAVAPNATLVAGKVLSASHLSADSSPSVSSQPNVGLGSPWTCRPGSGSVAASATSWP